MTDVNTVASFTTFSEWRKKYVVLKCLVFLTLSSSRTRTCACLFASSVHYKEMLEQVALYNKYLRSERHDRLPYLDSQTGVAQSDCYIWRSRSQRRRGREPGQVYSYPPIKWKMEFHRDIKSMCALCSTCTDVMCSTL